MSTTSDPGQVRRWHYAWTIAAVTFVTLLITAGIRATPGLLMVPLETEFGWSRTAISGAVAINLALFGLIGPFAASAMDRWGVRRLVAMVLAAVVATRWFDARRGVVLGALSAANATGQLVFLPMLARVIEQYGWRSAAMVVAVGALVVFAVVLTFMRDRPESIGPASLRPGRRCSRANTASA